MSDLECPSSEKTLPGFKQAVPSEGRRKCERGGLLRRLFHVYWEGRLTKPFLVWFWFPLAACIFLAGGIISALCFDGPFDWRYRTLSSLSSEVTNPAGYRYSCFGLMLSFSLAMPVCAYFRDRVLAVAPLTARMSCRALRVGFIGCIAVGFERLFSQGLALRVGKLHEYVSLVTFIGLAIGLAGFCLGLIYWLVRERKWSGWTLGSCYVAATVPILGTGLSQAYLYFVPNDLGWVGPHWAELGVPVYLSLAFWEWLLSAAIFSYLYLIVLFLPARPAEGA